METKIIEKDPSIAKKVKANDGYCPCMIGQEPENKCPCEMFRKQAIGECLCGRYEKVKVDRKEKEEK